MTGKISTCKRSYINPFEWLKKVLGTNPLKQGVQTPRTATAKHAAIGLTIEFTRRGW